MEKLLILSLLFMGCSITMQILNNSNQLKSGMTTTQVENIMGIPILSDFDRSIEEWHYCRTDIGGLTGDRFVVLFFENDKLITKRNYLVTMRDTRGATGSCENFVKMGNYRVPDSVKEIRLSY